MTFVFQKTTQEAAEGHLIGKNKAKILWEVFVRDNKPWIFWIYINVFHYKMNANRFHFHELNEKVGILKEPEQQIDVDSLTNLLFFVYEKRLVFCVMQWYPWHYLKRGLNISQRRRSMHNACCIQPSKRSV